MSQNKTFIFSHIPKTAGTSLKVHFEKHLENENEFIHFANVGFNVAQRNGLNPYYERPEALRSRAKVILGHKVNFKTKMLVEANEVEEIVIFRDPVAWEVSRFNQHANRLYKREGMTIDFNFWLNEVNKTHSQFDWFLSNYLQMGQSISKLNRVAKENLLFYTLSNFKHVLFLDNLNEKIRPIFNQLGISNLKSHENAVGKDKTQFFKDNNENQKLLTALCKNEILLYEKLRSQFG